jgi:hypothetical protein
MGLPGAAPVGGSAGVVQVGPHLGQQLASALYQHGLHLTIAAGSLASRPGLPQPPGARGPALVDFRVLSRGGTQFGVAWLGENEARAAELDGGRAAVARATAIACPESAAGSKAHDTPVLLVTRVDATEAGFVAVQQAAVPRGIRCVGVGADTLALSRALELLLNESASRRTAVRLNPHALAANLTETWAAVPGCVGEAAPLCKNIRGLVERVERRDPELAAVVKPSSMSLLDGFVNVPLSRGH